MVEFSRTPRPVRQIQLTSLIDVTFLLLKFFILTSSFAVIESLDVSLPASASSVSASEANTARIDLMANGMVLINHKKASEMQIGSRIAELLKKDPKRKLLIRCDERAVVQQLVDIMDVIHLAGGQNVSVIKRSEGAQFREEQG